MTTAMDTVITFNPRSVSVTASLLDLVQMLERSGFRHLPVTDAGRQLVGVISDKDVVESLQTVANQSRSRNDAISAARRIEAEELMSRRPLSVDLTRCEPMDALQTLLQNRVHSLPVVDNRQLVGMITSTDFLREFTYGDSLAFRDPASEHCDRRWETVEAADRLSIAEQTLGNQCMECLIVEQGGLPLASLTERDMRGALLRRAASTFLAHEDASEPTFGSLVQSAPTLRPGETLGEAAIRMLDCQRQSIAVIAQSGRVHGVVREERILELMLTQ